MTNYLIETHGIEFLNINRKKEEEGGCNWGCKWGCKWGCEWGCKQIWKVGLIRVSDDCVMSML